MSELAAHGHQPLLCASTLFIMAPLLLDPLHKDAHESTKEKKVNKPELWCPLWVVSKESACEQSFAWLLTADYQFFSPSNKWVSHDTA